MILRRPKILLADDQEGCREVVRDHLTDDGYEVLLAANGMECLRLATQNVGLILLDVEMPVLNGPDTFRRLRCNPATSALPVLFLTGGEAECTQKAMLDLGAFGWLNKPVRASELRIKVNALAWLLGNVAVSWRPACFAFAVAQEQLRQREEDAEMASSWNQLAYR